MAALVVGVVGGQDVQQLAVRAVGGVVDARVVVVYHDRPHTRIADRRDGLEAARLVDSCSRRGTCGSFSPCTAASEGTAPRCPRAPGVARLDLWETQFEILNVHDRETQSNWTQRHRLLPWYTTRCVWYAALAEMRFSPMFNGNENVSWYVVERPLDARFVADDSDGRDGVVDLVVGLGPAAVHVTKQSTLSVRRRCTQMW